MDDQEQNESPSGTVTTTPEQAPAHVEGQSSSAEQSGLRPLSDVEGEKDPGSPFFNEENSHTTLKKTRKKEAVEMPKQKKPKAIAEENTVKESSDQVQQTLPAVVGETAPAADTAPSVDAKLIEEAVRFINEKSNETVYKGAMEIGAYILKHFFDDDIVLASSKNPRKATSYRALCQSEGLIPRPETLSLMVRVAAQEKFFLSMKLETESLSYTHKAELVKLLNDDEKVKLVKSAIKKALTTRELEARIEAIRKQRVKEIKPIAQFFDKEIGNPEKLFADEAVLQLLEDRGGLQQELKQLKPKKLRALSVKATQRAEETKKWAQLYQDLVDAIEEISGKE